LRWLIVEETKPTLTVHKDQEVKSTLRLIDEKETSLEYDQLKKYFAFIYLITWDLFTKGDSLVITIARIACKTICYYYWTFDVFNHLDTIRSY
jgi:hypothetical protein